MRDHVGPLPRDERSAQQHQLLEPVLGVDAPNLFSTIVRNEELYEAWLPFCMKLLRRSAFSRRERELVILRTAGHHKADYEIGHHREIGERAGLSAQEINALLDREVDGSDWDEGDRVLLDATDQLIASTTIDEATWSRLAERFTDAQLVELPMLVGHYTLLAMLLNGLRVPLDEASPQPDSSRKTAPGTRP